MAFLRFLEALRTPALTAFFSAVTYAGDELVFMAIAITVFWCVSKRQGYYVFAVGLGGTVVNQWLKLAFRVPRPWVLDPGFTIVEAARAGAGGYSFPSGHTQNIVGTLGCVALCNRQKWLRVLCGVFIVLVPFSRMYLGVHTPLDVGVGFACAAALVCSLGPCFRDDENLRRAAPVVLGGLLALSLAYVLWAHWHEFPADVDGENLAGGVKNGWSLLGCALGLLVSRQYDERVLRYDVRAPLLGQLCKVALGLALLVALRAGLKYALAALFGAAPWTNAVRYFAMVIFAGCVWPWTFPWFRRLGRKQPPSASSFRGG